ncbi:MAG: hypothetical protein ACHRXM_09645 [Isosphaerales bacterium]
MPAEVLQLSSHTLTLSSEERDTLLDLLRQALGETRVEVHRTHTPAFRDKVLGQECIIRAVIERLEQIGPDQTEVSPGIPAGIEEGSAVADELYINEQGRFQMAAEDLEDFIQFVRDNEVCVEVETADALHSGGKVYGYGRLLHLFDADSVSDLYRMWNVARQSRAAGEVT